MQTTSLVALAGLQIAHAAFAPTTVQSLRSAIRMQETVAPEAPPPLPKIETMMVGDGTLAGDMNFDPLMIADNPGKLAWYREAEIKHARLAMLAAFGWPVSEITNFGKLLTSDGRAPSLLNGGLGEINTAYWAVVVALGIFAESKGLDKQYGKNRTICPACSAL